MLIFDIYKKWNKIFFLELRKDKKLKKNKQLQTHESINFNMLYNNCLISPFSSS